MGARSKGCVTCKARRVKCDEGRPTCIRCHKAGITCRGYPLIIIDEKPRMDRAKSIAKIQQHALSTIHTSSQTLHHSSRKVTFPYAGSFHTELNLTAFKDDIFISFLVSKMVEGRDYGGLAERAGFAATQGWWVGEMIEKTNHRSRSLDALAAMFYGRSHHVSDIMVGSLKTYGEALGELRTQILDPDRAREFATLASMTTLCIYELVASRSGYGWTLHASGLGQLIELRGPWRHKKFPEKTVFLEHRFILVSRAVLSRKRTFLSQPIWKEVPWEDDLSSKLPVDYLIDILCDIAGLSEDVDTYLKDLEYCQVQFLDLKSRLMLAFEQLNAWWRRFLERNPQACHEVWPSLASTIMRDEDGLLFASLLHYDSFWTVYTVCIHNSIRILLLELHQMLSGSPDHELESPSVEPNPTTPLLGITTDSEGLAKEIMRSMEFCYTQSNHYLGTFCLLFPLDFVCRSLDEASREARWLWKNDGSELSRIAGHDAGHSVIKLLPSYQFDTSLKKERIKRIAIS